MSLRWKIAQQAEIRWWQQYLKKKPKADYLQWKKKYWTTLLEEIQVSINPSDSITDIGCGPAGIFMIFPENQVTAVDPLLDQYDEKINHFNPSSYPNVDFHSTPLESFESKEQFDKVFCLNAINHVADLDLCFDKIVQLTKPGGTLIVSIDAHNHNFFKKIFQALPGDILHPHQYNLEEYSKMLTDRNCTIINSIKKDSAFLFDYYILIAQTS